MQTINSKDDQDLIQDLPNEMFTSILSFLPPSAIAHSSSACKPWRSAILSSPTLHQEIDLTKLKEDEDILPIVCHFQRLSFLSLNRLIKVSLNMTPFLTKWIPDQGGLNGQRLGALDILLTTLQQSQQTLKEIVLLLDGPGWSRHSDCDILPFLLQLLRNLASFTSIQSIWLEAPIWFSLKTGNSGGKTITVLNRIDKIHGIDIEYGSADPELIAEFMQEVKRVSGGSSTEFLANPSTVWDEEESLNIVKELWDCPLLENLNVSCLTINQTFWDFALQLQHLRSLAIDVHTVEEVLQVPQGVRKAANLKELDFGFNYYGVDWNSISEWAGDKLEKLALRLESQSMKGLFVSALDESVVINSQHTIKELYINNLGGNINLDQAATPEKLSQTKFFFPNLEKLYLADVEAPIFHCFSNAEYSKLQNLALLGFDSYFARPIFDCLMKILEKTDTKIVELEVYIVRLGSFEWPQANFNFSSLKSLELGRIGEEHQTGKVELPKWLLTCSYPRLTNIVIDRGDYRAYLNLSSRLEAEVEARNFSSERFLY